MKKIPRSILTICLLASATTAFGAVKSGSFTATPLIGGYNYADDPSKGTSLVLGGRAGYNFTQALGIEAVYDFLSKEKDLSETKFNAHRYGGQALYHFFPDSTFVPYIAAGYSGIRFDGKSMDEKVHGAFDYGIGAKMFLSDDFALRGDVRHIVYSYKSGIMSNLEYTLGAYFQFGAVEPVAKAVTPAAAPVAEPEIVKEEVLPLPVATPPADSDNDGVIDSIDTCPNTPANVAVDDKGCPLDSDKDKVFDYLDKCPGTPIGTPVDSDGCPLDTDKDGVADYLDKCPDTPPGSTVDVSGCIPDTDRDGVPDSLDKCPETPAGSAVDITGCQPDTDKDGVFDSLDKCPETPPGSTVDTNGCSLEVAKQFCDKPSLVAITFDTNKSDVKSRYNAGLDEIGNFMKTFPNSKGTIEGHTDSIGSEALNTKLSQARAESVRAYIINKFGIDGSRISAKGYGSAKPVASNKTSSGRTKNRRIEAVFSCE
ncbi:MAG: OmpA family protein [Desulfuromonadaceae bacterium]|nr:OmpA family protein [Desulfuromonadaceae bacterium]MDD2855445.1 OmpA family protein [Desulfuromonadaceae bacterium]